MTLSALDRLGISYGTDKSSLAHGYLAHYEERFSHLKNADFVFMEIGIDRGGSLKMWSDFFPNATIVGVDIKDECRKYAGDRRIIEIGSQADKTFMRALGEKYRPTVIIDDGSHQTDHIMASFEALWPSLRGGGIYIIEDVSGHYPEWRGTTIPWALDYFTKVAYAKAVEALRENRMRDVDEIRDALSGLTLPNFVVLSEVTNKHLHELGLQSGAIGLIILFEMAMTYLRRNFIEVTATRIDGRLNLYMMRKLLALPMDYFERNPVGLIMGKLANIWKVRNFLTGQLFMTMIDMIMFVALVPVLVWVNWRLALFAFIMAGIIFVIIYLSLAPLNRLFHKIVKAEELKSTYLTETVYGMRTIKSLALEGRRLHGWDARVAQSIGARYDYGVFANYPQTLIMPFERLIYSGSMLLGAAVALANPELAAPGALMAFGMLASRTAQPLVQLAKLLQDLGDIQAAIGEASSVLNHPPEQGRAGSGLRLPVYGNITFQNVDFRYAAGSPLALNDVSIDIRAGTIFGIMGRSGSGKTTVTRLLQGLNTKYEGIIKIDGMDLREMDLRHLRTSIGVVPQENFLFSGTVRENIGMAKPNATFGEIVRAAQLAGAEEFIERMPRGYDTFLEEGGSNLSGGQRQRLAIARALVLDPPVMILDEATSALDAESEAIINANLLRIAQSRTIICVSHRLAMLVPADAILVMEKGKVYDIGSHAELLHRCDIYKHMWYTQNRHSHTGPIHAPIAIAHSSGA